MRTRCWNVLNRMKRDDPRRPEAIARIERWLEKERVGVVETP